ncbi:MAG: elongation factor P [Deltaproteobacteria bacterium RIFCSPLOWO2_02_FULL_47_10]|nr:MAG: elongation factor P [Deltaproteobacteria bacterium RIFCSPLOWO2_02_FULL_47_10]
MISATQIKLGMVIIHNDDLWRVTERNHVAPGNWRAMVQTKLKNLKTGSQIEHRFSADDKVERAMLEQHDMEYLYSDGSGYHFMSTEDYEQIALSPEVLGDAAKYLQPNCHVKIDIYGERAVAIELPKMMAFKVVEADPSVKRATASAQFKNATLENGLIVRVPPFVEAGDSVKIDTETGEYVERA